jgi:hypothetical protein
LVLGAVQAGRWREVEEEIRERRILYGSLVGSPVNVKLWLEHRISKVV